MTALACHYPQGCCLSLRCCLPQLRCRVVAAPPQVWSRAQERRVVAVGMTCDGSCCCLHPAHRSRCTCGASHRRSAAQGTEAPATRISRAGNVYRAGEACGGSVIATQLPLQQARTLQEDISSVHMSARSHMHAHSHTTITSTASAVMGCTVCNTLPSLCRPCLLEPSWEQACRRQRSAHVRPRP